MIDTDKYEGHLADALICVREGGVDCDFSKIRIEDALADMGVLIAEVKRLQKRNEWLEEVVGQAQEHYHIDLSDEGWPRWREEE